jgi:hypothetical protein
MKGEGSIRQKHTDIPPLHQEDTQEEDEKQDHGANPSVGRERCALVEVGLVHLCCDRGG